MPEYTDIEYGIQWAIFKHYNLPTLVPPIIKQADEAVLKWEFEQVRDTGYTQYPDDDIPINDQTDRPEPEDFRVDSCSERAQRTFCNRCLPSKVSCRGAAGAR
jgi:hypothetical protein